MARGVGGGVFASFLVEHGVDHTLQLLDRPYLHAELFRLVQDVCPGGLLEGLVEDILLILELGGVDGALGMR